MEAVSLTRSWEAQLLLECRHRGLPCRGMSNKRAELYTSLPPDPQKLQELSGGSKR